MKVELTVSTLADARATRPPETSNADGEFRRTLDGAREERDPSIDRHGEPVRRDRQEDVEENPHDPSDGSIEDSGEIRAIVSEVTNALVEVAALAENVESTTAVAVPITTEAEPSTPITPGAPATGATLEVAVDTAETSEGALPRAAVTTDGEAKSALSERVETSTPGAAPTAEGEAVDDADLLMQRDPRVTSKSEAAEKLSSNERTILQSDASARVSDAARSLETAEDSASLPVPPKTDTSSSKSEKTSERVEFHLASRESGDDTSTAKLRSPESLDPAVNRAPDRTADVLRAVRSTTTADGTVDRVNAEARTESGRPVTELGAVDRSQPRLSEARAAAAPSTSAVSVKDDPLDESQLAKRIHRLVRRSLSSGRGILRVQIDPPNLGRVQVRFDVRDEKIGVRFEVENKEVRQVLDRHVEELRDTLAGFGRADAEVSVDVRDGSSDAFEESDKRSRGSFGTTDGADADDIEVVTLSIDGAHVGRNVDVSL